MKYLFFILLIILLLSFEVQGLDCPEGQSEACEYKWDWRYAQRVLVCQCV